MSRIETTDAWSSTDDSAWDLGEASFEPACGAHHQAGDLVAGRYRLLHKIGEGSMGAVWGATSVMTKSAVALKLMRPELRSAELGDYFLREARAAGRLDHAGIVRMLDAGQTEGGDPYLVMELLEGESLRSALAREGAMAPERAVALLLPVAGAMHAAHEAGVIHRDLKPDNVMLVRREGGALQPKVVDFGVAKIVAEQDEEQASGDFEVFGTPDYMPPEQVLALPTVDRRADIWSFCAMLYEALSGRPPFSSRNALDGLRAVLQDAVPSLVDARGLDADLWAIVERGLRKEPSSRWSSLRELGEALAAWLCSRGVREDARGAPLQGEWPPRHRRGRPAPQCVDVAGVGDASMRLEGAVTPRHQRCSRQTRTSRPPTIAARQFVIDVSYVNVHNLHYRHSSAVP
ncbi:serine/threonine-protein kinase [Sorangium sp. So ce1036]|uniref:serine/threonine-protein kinase n=1 Tax=Sorangium sp. So ce1036 TaxID=3133328 RepID=UPI003F0E27B0